MNNLQKLIKLRRLTIVGIASKIGHGYHMTQKVIKGTTYKRRDGSLGIYSSRPVEEAVAQLLSLTHNQVWGPRSGLTLRRLIKEELKKQAKAKEQDLQRQWLNNNNNKIQKK